MEAQRFDSARGRQQDDKPGQGNEEWPPVGMENALQAAVAPSHQEQQEDHPPPGGEPEEIQQEVRHPGADAAARIGDALDLRGMRPAGVGLAVTEEDETEVEGDAAEHQPARLLQEGYDLFRQGLGDGFFLHA